MHMSVIRLGSGVPASALLQVCSLLPLGYVAPQMNLEMKLWSLAVFVLGMHFNASH